MDSTSEVQVFRPSLRAYGKWFGWSLPVALVIVVLLALFAVLYPRGPLILLGFAVLAAPVLVGLGIYFLRARVTIGSDEFTYRAVLLRRRYPLSIVDGVYVGLERSRQYNTNSSLVITAGGRKVTRLSEGIWAGSDLQAIATAIGAPSRTLSAKEMREANKLLLHGWQLWVVNNVGTSILIGIGGGIVLIVLVIVTANVVPALFGR